MHIMKMIDVLVIAFMRKEVTLLSLPHSYTLFFSNYCHSIYQ